EAQGNARGLAGHSTRSGSETEEGTHGGEEETEASGKEKGEAKGQEEVTTEDEFQQLLDANPEDRQTRLVFADWLQERNDPRAEGGRAIAVLPVVNCRNAMTDNGHYLWMKRSWAGSHESVYPTLTDDWVGSLEGGFQLFTEGAPVPTNDVASGKWRDYGS